MTASKIVYEMYLSRNWVINKDFEAMTLTEMNEVLSAALQSLREQSVHVDMDEFNKLSTFIKTNIIYDPIDILIDMYVTKNWSPHKVLLDLPVPELNEIFLMTTIKLLNDKLIQSDNLTHFNMYKYIKSHQSDKLYKIT